MIARITNGGAGTTINQASGEKGGPGLFTIGAVAVGAYAAYRVFM